MGVAEVGCVAVFELGRKGLAAVGFLQELGLGVG